MKTITFKEFRQEYQITEEFHKEIQSILDEPESENRNVYNKFGSKTTDNKFNRVAKKIKELSSQGIDTGAEDDKPKKGSSRAYLKLKDQKKITLDGKPTSIPTGIKVAIHGTLDKHTGSPELLGEMQNRHESDHYLNSQHGIISQDSHTGEYHTNENGVLAPAIDSHRDSHWLEMPHTEKLTKAKFKSLTKTESHPQGLDHDKMYKALNNDWKYAHGQMHGNDGLDHVREHPFYQNMADYISNSDTHPADMVLGNMGIFKHPHTGKEYPVVRDHGYSHDIMKAYNNARKKRFDTLRNNYKGY